MSKYFSLIIAVMLIIPALSFAQFDKAFGGKSTLVTPCTCDATFMITILDSASMLAPMNYIYNPMSTTLLGYFLVLTPNVYTIGLASPIPVQCMVANPGGCAPVGFGYSMSLVGTSL